jgi:hypothetical protein
MNIPRPLRQAARRLPAFFSAVLCTSSRLFQTLSRLQRIERNGALVLCIPGAPIVRLH